MAFQFLSTPMPVWHPDSRNPRCLQSALQPYSLRTYNVLHAQSHPCTTHHSPFSHLNDTPPVGVRLTPYILFNITVILSFGVPKAILSYRGATTATTLDWIAGVFFALMCVCLNLIAAMRYLNDGSLSSLWLAEAKEAVSHYHRRHSWVHWFFHTDVARTVLRTRKRPR
jgi:hypothetical protein